MNIKASTVQQQREEVYAALQHSVSFYCLADECRDCEELEPTPTEIKSLWIKNGSSQTSHGVVCGHKQIPLHEMRVDQ